MVATNHLTYTYVGMAGEGDFIGEGGIFRQADGEDGWDDISAGLPGNPQVRALLLKSDNSAIVFAGTQDGVYRSADRGESWQRLADPAEGREVWSLAADPSDPNTISPDTSPAPSPAPGTAGTPGRIWTPARLSTPTSPPICLLWRSVSSASPLTRWIPGMSTRPSR